MHSLEGQPVTRVRKPNPKYANATIVEESPKEQEIYEEASQNFECWASLVCLSLSKVLAFLLSQMSLTFDF